MMNDERMKILKMISEGKLSPEEGDNLLRALEPDRQTDSRSAARWLVVRVYEQDTNRVHVNVRLPVRLAGKLIRFSSKFIDKADIDMEREVYSAIAQGETGKVLDIDTEDGTRIEVSLEG